jgi:hypothetical protein
MALTLTQLRLIAKHALGGGDPATIVTDANGTLDWLINEAGQQFVQAERWQFLMEPPTTLDFTADQAYVALPADFAEIETLEYNDLLRHFRFVTPRELTAIRAQTITWDGAYVGAIFWPEQTVATANSGAPRVELHPTPGSTVSGALRISYRRGWTVLSSGTSVANLPLWAEPAYVAFLRAWVYGHERLDSEAERQAQLAAVINGATFKMAKKRDCGGHTDYGPIRGGAAAQILMQHEPPYLDGVVSDPS